jgi:hypothetical protein
LGGFPSYTQQRREIREAVPVGSPTLPLPPEFGCEDERDAEEDLTETEESDNAGGGDGESDEDDGEDNIGDQEASYEEEGSDEREWEPQAPAKPKPQVADRGLPPKSGPVPPSANANGNRLKATSTRLSGLARELADLKISNTALQGGSQDKKRLVANMTNYKNFNWGTSQACWKEKYCKFGFDRHRKSGWENFEEHERQTPRLRMRLGFTAGLRSNAVFDIANMHLYLFENSKPARTPRSYDPNTKSLTSDTR